MIIQLDLTAAEVHLLNKVLAESYKQEHEAALRIDAADFSPSADELVALDRYVERSALHRRFSDAIVASLSSEVP